ncbi:MAG TPA: 2-C-methyl-D-erythritol 2,4-cyclodiphosphate synthase [Candidatus Deferrimicrobium sp.]|nr:2-C-methyl-D-erythritol 2,4-cyclodiphosphate synthase [Candidatus Deferrimicrobium sp.]
MKSLRIGHGLDVHPLVDGRDLIVGGIKIPFAKGLAGHSDGDVLLHAIMDALLGAAGLPDIGHQFPPSDARYKGADSVELLKTVRQLVVGAGFPEIINVDSVLMAEQPRFGPYVSAMQQRIADAIGVPPSRITIKATTTERLGFLGREEGIAASAVCLISGDG